MRIITPIVFFFLSFYAINSFAADPVAATGVEPLANTPDITSSLLKVTGGLLLVVIAILGSAWFYRRFGNVANISNDSLKVIGGLSMGQKERVVLMQVGDEQLLLGVSPGRIQTLHVLSKPIETTDVDVNEKNKFSSQLNAAIKQWKSS